MWINKFRFLWISIKINGSKKFRLFLPISIYTFWELLDCVSDLMTFASLFVPRAIRTNKHIPFHLIEELTSSLTDLLCSITEDGPYKLLEVSHESINISIQIR